ncbi:MAG: glycosyltransferase family 39 protein [Burkholderiaceae bacterium]|nr:glycosyltransferase family 39 protein [Burkholderiaceae bacterium]
MGIRAGCQVIVGNGYYHFPSPASANLGPQAYWGALFCIPFGFSFTALRFSTLVLGLLGALALFFLIKELGGTRRTALVGALVLIVNPLYFGLANSFMTDVPFTTVVILSLFCLARGFRREDSRYLIVGLLFAFAAVMIRQVGLVVLMGFSAAYAIKYGIKPMRLLVAIAALLAGAAMHFGYEHWLIHTNRMPILSPHAALESAQIPSPWVARRTLVVAVTYVGFFLLPFIVLFHNSKSNSLRSSTSMTFTRVTTLIAIVVLALLWWQGLTMPSSRNVLTKYRLGPLTLRDTFILGLNIPITPIFLEFGWVAISAMGAFGATLLTWLLLRMGYQFLFARVAESRPEYWVAAMLLVAPAAYLLILFVASTRLTVFDRYFLLFVPFCVLLLSTFANWALAWVPRRSPRASIALLVAYAVFSVAATHDYLSWNRTRWVALNSLIYDTKAKPEHIDGGYEFNGWFLHDANYVRSREKSWWWVSDDEYVVASGPVPGYVELRRYGFRRWLLGQESNIYVLRRAI